MAKGNQSMSLQLQREFARFVARVFAAVTVLCLALAVAGCTAASGASKDAKPVVRIGYFANLTHAPAMIARQQKLFEKALAEKAHVEYTVFTAGPTAIEAMRGRAVDITYVGPNPAITGYIATDGTLLSVISGATSGGAKFIVKPELAPAIESKPTRAEVDGLRGAILASPQLGGTQDVALRNYLRIKDIPTDGSAGSATVSPSDNATTLALLQKGDIDGAWVPEPWATRLVQEGGGKVFLDEASLWPDGAFVTTHLISSKPFLNKYPGLVRAVLTANQQAIEFLNDPSNHSDAVAQVQAELFAQTGKTLGDAVIESAWPSLQFTSDPQAETLVENFGAAVKVGQLRGYFSDDIRGIYELAILNSIRRQSGELAIELPATIQRRNDQ